MHQYGSERLRVDEVVDELFGDGRLDPFLGMSEGFEEGRSLPRVRVE